MSGLRVLYDISALGLGHIAIHGRAGSHRVDREIAERLAHSAACELHFCANLSSLAWHGCAAYLRARPALAHVPLAAPPATWLERGVRTTLVAAHRRLTIRRAGRALPGLVRSGGSFIDARVHRPVIDTVPPADVLHSSTTPLPPPPRGRGPRRFLTVYDLRAGRADAGVPERAYERALLGSLRDGDRVLTSSASTRRELCARGIAPERIAVVPLAADPSCFRPATRGGAEEDAGGAAADAGLDREIRARLGVPSAPYLLMLDAVHPRKNVARAVEAFARLVGQERVPDLVLVLAGGQATPARAAAAANRHPALRGRVAATGFVEDPELAALYRGALGFVYPSLYEGFGLPPLEAMQCGTPVITANTSSLPEVVGDAGAMVDPHDVDAFAAAMLALWQDEAGRAAARARGLARAAAFSWERTVASTLDAYRSAVAADR